jgi:signal transduction histidine kinase
MNGPQRDSCAEEGLRREQEELRALVLERERTITEASEMHRRLHQSREAERLQLAQELHDGPTQELIALKFELMYFAQNLTDEAQITHIVAIGQKLERVARQLRLLAQELRPPILVHFGLAAAIRSHTKSINEVYSTPNIQMAFGHEDADGNIPEEMAFALYRIYQQAMENAIQHAEAELVLVHLASAREQVQLTIQDNGRGFLVPAKRVELVRLGQLGLVAMEEYAESVGARLEVESQPGKGTLVRVTAPVPAA